MIREESSPGALFNSLLGGWGKEMEDAAKLAFAGKGDGYDTGDMAANAVGRACGIKKKRSCEEQCDEAFKNGSLYPPKPPPPPPPPLSGDWGNYDPTTGIAYPL